MKHSLLSVPALVLCCASQAHAQWSENFDTYGANTPVVGQGGWTEWSVGAGANVSNTVALSPANSIDIAGPTDLVHDYSGYTSGKWVYRAMQYVPSTMVGQSYFILLNTYLAPAGPYNWSVQVKFDAAAGLVSADAGASTPATHPLLTDQWVEIKVFIDLDEDWCQFYYDGDLLDVSTLADHPTLGGGYRWTGGVFGGGSGLAEIQAVDLYANNATSVYYDDISLQPFVFETVGKGCPGSMGNVTVTMQLPPTLGGVFLAQIDNLPLGACFNVIGLSRATSSFGPLPLDLGSFGMPTCTMYTSIDAANFMVSNPSQPNSVVFAVPIPNDPFYIGFEMHQQVLSLDTAANAAGAVTSDAMSIKIQ